MMVELLRSRTWSNSRVNVKSQTRLFCQRLTTTIFLLGLITATIMYLEKDFHNVQEHLQSTLEWKPVHSNNMLISSNNLPRFQTGGRAANKRKLTHYRKSLMHNYHVCMEEWQGGLGNRMFQYAALYVAATQANKTVKLPTRDALKLPFETGSESPFFFSCHGRTLAEELPCAYDERLMQISKTNGNIRLKGYWQSWKYFRHQEIDLRREFQFRRDIEQAADEFLRSFTNFTQIGVHIRRGDMLSKESKKYGYQLPPPHYFYKALNWFRRRFNNAIFIVCSNDIKYSKSLLGDHKDVFFSENHSPALDLAILSKCEHTVMSIGTFGWWAGWLASGQTIYYKNYARKGSEFEEDLVPDDYFPPTWIGLE